MSLPLISRSGDLRRLIDEGYHLDVQDGYLIVLEVPYLTGDQVVKRGLMASTLSLAGDVTTQPDTHVMYFGGDYPCDASGRPIESIRHRSRVQVLGGVEVQHSFSAKPRAGRYRDYYEKVTTYAAILGGPANTVDPNATARVFTVVAEDASDATRPFNYVDTATSRAGLVEVSKKLEGQRVGIVGVGGTGSYVLDLVAKTPVSEINLYDPDAFLQHNAFRAPGAPSLDELTRKPSKVEYFAAIYSRMHRSVRPNACRLDDSDLSELEGLDFVFVCIDDNEARGCLSRYLVDAGVPFVDVGMGVSLDSRASLGGILRVTTSTRGMQDHLDARLPTRTIGQEADYTANIQIAELNALNAALAVIRWKKLCGFYRDLEGEHHTTYTIDGNSLLNDHREDLRS